MLSTVKHKQSACSFVNFSCRPPDDFPMVTHMIKLYTFFECFEKESSPVAEFVGILFMKFLYFCAFFWLALDSRLSG